MKKQANYIVIPDIHGQLTQYLIVEKYIKDQLLRDRTIHIVFLGDYIDRGEGGTQLYFDRRTNKKVEKYFEDIGSKLVIKHLFDLELYFQKNNISYTFLMGNHEDKFIFNISNIESFSMQKNDNSSKDYMAMYNTILGFGQDFELLSKTKAFFEKMPYYYCDRENNLFFVHAGVNPDYFTKERDIDVFQSKKSDYLNIREKFFTSFLSSPYRIIFGHTPIDSIVDEDRVKSGIDEKLKIIHKPDKIGLDSGNYRNGYINILRIEDDKFWLIKSSNINYCTLL